MPTVDFGSLDAARAARDRWEEHLCSDDDGRLTSVTFSSDVPDDVLDRARRDAADSLAEQESGPGQADLTDHERDRIDFSKGRANVPWAQSIKAIAADEGVSDWTAHVDPTLTVDEHREVMANAGGGGQRMDSEDSAREQAGRHARRAQDSECDHARGHCVRGDPEACEFLTDTCGFDEDEVDDILARREPERPDVQEPELTGKEKGALKRSWNGYKAAVDRVAEAMETLVDEWEHAQQAGRSINAVRKGVGQEPIHFDRLEELQADLLDVTRKAAADCHECHADHAGHEHDVTTGDREDVRTFVQRGRASTPVGSGGDLGDDPTDDVVEEDIDDTDQEADQFAVEKQGTLGSGVEPDETAEDKQVTLGGEDADDTVGPLPSTWTREGSNWIAGPYKVQLDRVANNSWDVRLIGPNNSETIAQGLPDAAPAEQVAEGFVERVDPDDVSFHSKTRIVPEAAAEAKRNIDTSDSGLGAFS